MRLQIIIFLIFSFLNISSVNSTDFTCSNTENWNTLADDNYDFYTSRIKPDGSPTSSLTSDQQLNEFYEEGGYELVANPDPECYTATSCTEGEECICTHRPQSGCARTTWQVVQYPTLVSGGVGTPMPPFPDPTYPSSWDERAVYSHTFDTDTTDSTILLNIGTNYDSAFGDSITTTKCSDGTTTIGGADVIVKYFLVNGLSTFDQSFENFYNSYELREDHGVCGIIHQYWTEGPHKTVSRPAVSNAIPVIVYVAASEPDPDYDYSDRLLGCTSPYVYRGNFIAQGQACGHIISSGINNYRDCPEGYTYAAGGIGSSASCRSFVSAEYTACPSGSEVDPSNSGQCRTLNTPPVVDPPVTDPPVVDPPVTDPPVVDPPVTDPPVVDPSVTDPPVVDPPADDPPADDPPNTNPPSWCTASSLVWDSSTSTCRSTDGGGIVIPGDNPDLNSNDSNLVSFGEAPLAGDSTGTRDISDFGFYDPTYGSDTTLSSFVVAEIAKWDTTTLRTRLMTFVPTSGTGVLPKKCFTLSVSTQEFCLDLSSYAFAFDALRALLYIFSGWTAFRIVSGV